MSVDQRINELKDLASPIWDVPPLVWIDPPSRPPEPTDIDYRTAPAVAPEHPRSPRALTVVLGTLAAASLTAALAFVGQNVHPRDAGPLLLAAQALEPAETIELPLLRCERSERYPSIIICDGGRFFAAPPPGTFRTLPLPDAPVLEAPGATTGV